MINWINSWAQGIIVAVIISTVVEMILPDSKNKKYIKTVIGVYIVFTIVYPIMNKVWGKTIDVNSIISKEKYINNNYIDMGDNLIANANINIEDTYVESTKADIKARLETKGYIVNKIDIEIETEDENNYGQIKSLYLNLTNIDKSNNNENTENNNNIENVTSIEKINVDISNNENLRNTTNSINENTNNSNENFNEVKELLENAYNVKKENIYINV